MWSEEQLNAAFEYGEVIDIRFPDVSPDYSEEDLDRLALKYAEEIINAGSDCVMCQGEATLAFRVVEILKDKGITCVAACSNRVSTEKIVNGIVEKTSEFKFVRYRGY